MGTKHLYWILTGPSFAVIGHEASRWVKTRVYMEGASGIYTIKGRVYYILNIITNRQQTRVVQGHVGISILQFGLRICLEGNKKFPTQMDAVTTSRRRFAWSGRR
jgi:hypothetical protein